MAQNQNTSTLEVNPPRIIEGTMMDFTRNSFNGRLWEFAIIMNEEADPSSDEYLVEIFCPDFSPLKKDLEAKRGEKVRILRKEKIETIKSGERAGEKIVRPYHDLLYSEATEVRQIGTASEER
jgi:hypothetical protein